MGVTWPRTAGFEDAGAGAGADGAASFGAGMAATVPRDGASCADWNGNSWWLLSPCIWPSSQMNIPPVQALVA